MNELDRTKRRALQLMQDLHDQRDRENESTPVDCIVPTCGEKTRAGNLCSNCTLLALAQICGDEHLPYRLDGAVRTAAELRHTILKEIERKTPQA